MNRFKGALMLGASVIALVPSVFATSACQIGAGSCLRMSDCEDGFYCREGVCVTNTSDAPTATTEGGAPVTATTAMPTTSSTSPTTTTTTSDASSTTDADAGDASTSDAAADADATDQ